LQSIKRFVADTYALVFARKELFYLNRLLFYLSLHGLGILNEKLSGEQTFLRRLAKRLDKPLILDVGANVGSYSNRAKLIWPNATIYAFEPHPKTFVRLEAEASKRGYVALNLGCGDKEERLQLYDYKGYAEGSMHASLYGEAIEEIHGAESQSYAVNVTTIDNFVAKNEIQRIHLLKIDAEGNEIRVIWGAKKCIANGLVDIIQFEFNEMNVISRSFFRDFRDALHGYKFYRLLPNGLLPLEPYKPLMCELFAYQNIVAVRTELTGLLSRTR
jgi:FkbM family methyltransferase